LILITRQVRASPQVRHFGPGPRHQPVDIQCRQCRQVALKSLRADKFSALLSGHTDSMKTLAVIFLLALGAVAGAIYTDALFTSAQADGSAGDLPIMQGQSRNPPGWW
jgi:hypothetical protein